MLYINKKWLDSKPCGPAKLPYLQPALQKPRKQSFNTWRGMIKGQRKLNGIFRTTASHFDLSKHPDHPLKLAPRSSPSPTNLVYTPTTKIPYRQQKTFHVLNGPEHREKAVPTQQQKELAHAWNTIRFDRMSSLQPEQQKPHTPERS